MEEAKRIELIYNAIQNAKEVIGMAYRAEGKVCVDALKDITDKEIQDYYFTLNRMCYDLSNRNVMNWQKEEQ